MRRINALALGVLLAGIICVAYAQIDLTGAGSGKKGSGSGGGGGCSYTGPGDTVSGALAAWGFEAYTAGTCGSAAVNVCNVSDVACADLSTSASTGKLVVTTIGGSDCSVVTCTIKTFYDLSGNGKNQTQATIANRATLTVSGQNGVACAQFTRSSSQSYNTPTITNALPFTFSTVAKRTGDTTSTQAIMATTGSGGEAAIGFSSTAGDALLYNGVVFQPAAADNAIHAMQGVLPTAGNGTLFIDGSSNSGATGTVSTMSGLFYIGSDPGSNFATMLFCEGLVYGIGFSAGQQSSMDSNQRAAGRWNF